MRETETIEKGKREWAQHQAVDCVRFQNESYKS